MEESRKHVVHGGLSLLQTFYVECCYLILAVSYTILNVPMYSQLQMACARSLLVAMHRLWRCIGMVECQHTTDGPHNSIHESCSVGCPKQSSEHVFDLLLYIACVRSFARQDGPNLLWTCEAMGILGCLIC